MLVDIYRMPPSFGVPLDRTIGVRMNEVDRLPYAARSVQWPRLPLSRSSFCAGNIIGKKPSHLYKAIHISDDGTHVFETVFSEEPSGSMCLYSNIISPQYHTLGISLPTAEYYQQRGLSLAPVSRFILPNADYGLVDYVVPPIFNEQQLRGYAHDLINLYSQTSGDKTSNPGYVYSPLYQHVPSVLTALIMGMFTRTPFNEVRLAHPGYYVTPDRWFNYEELAYSMVARGIECYLNAEWFDNIASQVIAAGPLKFSVTLSCSDASEGINSGWLVKEYQDPYRNIFNKHINRVDIWTKNVAQIAQQCIAIYCRLYDVDVDVFYERNPLETEVSSSITISKNMYDEVAITFNDLVNNRYVVYYTSFPIIALTSLAMGYT